MKLVILQTKEEVLQMQQKLQKLQLQSFCVTRHLLCWNRIASLMTLQQTPRTGTRTHSIVQQILRWMLLRHHHLLHSCYRHQRVSTSPWGRFSCKTAHLRHLLRRQQYSHSLRHMSTSDLYTALQRNDSAVLPVAQMGSLHSGSHCYSTAQLQSWLGHW